MEKVLNSHMSGWGYQGQWDCPAAKDAYAQPSFPVLHSGSHLHCPLKLIQPSQPAFIFSLAAASPNKRFACLIQSWIHSWRVQSDIITLSFPASSLHNKVSLISPILNASLLLCMQIFSGASEKAPQFCQVWWGSLPASREKDSSKNSTSRLDITSASLERKCHEPLTRFLLMHELFKCSHIVLVLFLLPPPSSYF